MEGKLPSSPIIAFENSAVPAGLDPLSPKPGIETPGYCQNVPLGQESSSRVGHLRKTLTLLQTERKAVSCRFHR
jgi:hypothetical protein